MERLEERGGLAKIGLDVVDIVSEFDQRMGGNDGGELNVNTFQQFKNSMS